MTDAQKEITRLAFSIYSSPGSYALLLGSGVSRSANIKTGWEIMLDLIQRLAIIEPNISDEVKTPDELLQWYEEKYEGEEPTYDNLLDRIAYKSIDRRNILSQYLESTLGEKIPQDAHKAIAKLVKLGYIRIILTTNFDRLLESALISEGIHPYLIYNDDAIDGCLSPIHIRDSCIIYKIHGDYKDTRLRNTPRELKEYPEKVNKYLSRIFEDFGLIVCGWSAEWDVALRKAICNMPRNKYGVYWTVKSDPKDKTKDIIEKINPNVIKIQGADDFFSALYENIDALRQYTSPRDALSAPIAIEQTKKFISDNDSTKLFNLLNHERTLVISELSSDKFAIDKSTLKSQGIADNEEDLVTERFALYENIIKPLCGICSTISFFDDDKYCRLIHQLMEYLTYHHEWHSCIVNVKNLQDYPLYLVNNITGVTALSSNHFNQLSSVIQNPIIIGQDTQGKISRTSPIESLNIGDILPSLTKKYKFLDNPEEEVTVYKHVYNFIFEQVSEYIPNKWIFFDEFQKFKFVCAMTYIDLNFENINDRILTQYISEISTIDLLRERRNFFGKPEKLDISPILDFVTLGRRYGDNWGLLKAGFFEGKIQRFEECFKKLSPFLE